MALRTAGGMTVNQTTTFAGYYGSFYSTADQSDGVTPTAFTFTNTADADGVSIVSGSQVTFAHAGTYNIQFSVQLHNTGGGGSGNTVNIWLRLNGSNVAWTDTKVTVPSNAPYVVAAWNFVISVAAGDNIQLVWLTDNSNIVIEAEAATATTPGIPSIILTAAQIR